MNGNSKFICLENGMLLACIAYLGNQCLNFCDYQTLTNTQLGILAGGSLIGGMLLDWFYKDNQYEKLFKMCGIVNKDNKVPLVIKKEKNKDKTITTLVISLPEGISQNHFEKKQQELEQFLNCKIEFGFNKNLIMRCIDMNLGTNYNYEFEECKNPTEAFVGYTHEGKFYFDVDKATQTIVAGEPNSGKSSLLRTLITSLILNKHNLDIYLIDFQDADLGIFEDCKKVKTYGRTPEDFEKLLDLMEKESERRLKLFASVRDKHYIQKLSVWNKYYPERALPYKICIIDEFVRLSEDEYKPLLDRFRTRVALDRKAGILYIASMQRPDVKVISGSIKGCMPTRVAFKCVTDTDSEVILDIKGAEKIKNSGRCLMKYLGEIKEVQCLYVEPEDVRKILKKHNAYKSKEDYEKYEQEIVEAKEKERKEIIEKFRKTNTNKY